MLSDRIIFFESPIATCQSLIAHIKSGVLLHRLFTNTFGLTLFMIMLALVVAGAPGAAIGASGIDSDGDGLSDEIELTLKKKDKVKFSPTNADSDGDGYPDSIEALQADPKSIIVINGADDLEKVLKKKPYSFLEVSALWCQPSWRFAPIYLETARINADAIGISFTVHQGSDDPSFSTSFTNDLGVTGFPTTLFVGTGGIILGKFIGYPSEDDFADRYKRLVNSLAVAAIDGYLSFPEALNARVDSGLIRDFYLDRAAFLSLAPPSGDDDIDGLTNEEELRRGTDPFYADSDHDGLKDGEEVVMGLDPLNRDSDHDGFSDGEETNILGSNPFDSNDPVFIDSDSDGINDSREILNGTDPNDSDTDNDGYTDGAESEAGSDPLDPASVPRPTTYEDFVALADKDSDADGWSDLIEYLIEYFAINGEVQGSTDRNGDGLRDLPEEIVELHTYFYQLDSGLWPFRVESGAIVTDADTDGLPDDQEELATSENRDNDNIEIDLDDEILRFINEYLSR